MKLNFAALSLLATALVGVSATLKGFDVSSYEVNVAWSTLKANGASFAYIKATEGIDFISTEFNQQYIGASDAGFIRGAYHFAHPDSSPGDAQAKYFIANGGGWSSDGRTLPGAVDLESGPNGAKCYSLSQAAMVSWIMDFSNTYHTYTGRYPVIYTTTDWWTTCTGNSAAFGNTNPLWIARYSSSAGLLPSGWPSYSFWQSADSGRFPGNQDDWNGDGAGLLRIARGA
ncbi:glycoside hydrolase family 25 protein [Umbelopsis sp. AD052]|nr:glycoside hydrolase family 25 protein [Umbelopsis sp. AD052]